MANNEWNVNREWSVLIRKNDRQQTFVQKLQTDPGLEADQARMLATELNAAFASQGLNWWAEAVEETDDDA